MAKILIIDDDEGICYVLTRIANQLGHTAESRHTLADAREAMSKEAYDILLLDVDLPDGSGLKGLRELSAHPSHPEVVVITGAGMADDADEAVRAGAWDYLQKGTRDEMRQALEQVLRYREEKEAARGEQREAVDHCGILGESPRMKECLEAMGRMARGESNVLLYGETGTGKEIFARALHQNSARRDGPFVVVDCASLPATLVESLLFGHVRGAFTGADRASAGLMQQADGGTLFMDEVGELPLTTQASFLRVLQQRCFRPVGGTHELRSDFRVIAATNRDLAAMSAEGTFRADLLYRLQGAVLPLPPLREREGDAALIAEASVPAICRRGGMPAKELSPAFTAMLTAYDWPGNVRELIHALEFAVNAACYENTLFPVHLPQDMRAAVLRKRMGKQSSAGKQTLETGEGTVLLGRVSSPPPPLSVFRDEVWGRAEKEYLLRLLEECGSDMNRACTVADVSLSRLYALLKKHNLSRQAR